MQNWNIEELEVLEGLLNLRIYLKYPNYEDLLKLQPKQRIKIIRQRKRAQFKAFIATLNKVEFTRIGSKIDPVGLEIKCDAGELVKFSKNRIVEQITLIKTNKELKAELESTPMYFSILARFEIQIENKTKGLQSFEDRIMLIKARNEKEAKQKLKKGFKDYEKPYLNTLGELVRWKFERYIDCYETNYNSLNELLADDKKGIELFSTLQKRRLKKDSIWIRNKSSST